MLDALSSFRSQEGLKLKHVDMPTPPTLSFPAKGGSGDIEAVRPKEDAWQSNVGNDCLVMRPQDQDHHELEPEPARRSERMSNTFTSNIHRNLPCELCFAPSGRISGEHLRVNICSNVGHG